MTPLIFSKVTGVKLTINKRITNQIVFSDQNLKRIFQMKICLSLMSRLLLNLKDQLVN